jgi:endonuclease YncB( thermonuclease family)
MGAETPFSYWFTVANVYDGDTIMGQLDMGLAHYLGNVPTPTYSIRLFGINAPELNASDPAVRTAAIAARDYLRMLIRPGDYIQIRSMGWDKYRMRIDGVPTTTLGVDACQAMLDSGHAVPYNP